MFGTSSMFDWLGLACETQILSKHLYLTVENGGADETGDGNGGKLFPGQLLIFPFDMKTRERFGELALTFELCLKKNEHTPHVSGKNFHALQFYRYDMFAFVRNFQSDEKWEPIIDNMMKIANGERLDDETYLQLVEAFTNIASRALHNTRRGCF